MPKFTTERLFGYGLRITREVMQMPVSEVTADGQEPTVSLQDVEITVITFTDDANGHRVEVPFTDERKQELVKALTGGITIASGIPTQ